MQNFFELYNLLIVLGMLVSIPCFFLDIKDKAIHRIVFSILLLASCLETFGVYSKLLGIENVFYYNIFYIYLETFIILYFFYTVFSKDNRKVILVYAGIFFFLWGIINSIYFQSIQTFQTYSYSVASMMIIGSSIYFFYGIFFKYWYKDLNLLSVPFFWIVTVILFFYSGSFLFFSTQIMWLELDLNLYVNLSTITKVLAVNMYLVMGIAFYAPFVLKDKKYSLTQQLR